MNQKTNSKTVIVTAIATAIGAAAGSYAVKDLFTGGLDGDDPLIKVAEEVNKTLPMILDSETRLDSTVGLAGTFTYNYSLINYTYSELDLDQFKSVMEPKLKNNYCTSEEMKQFLNKGIDVSFSYYGKEGKQVVKYSYKPSDCKG